MFTVSVGPCAASSCPANMKFACCRRPPHSDCSDFLPRSPQCSKQITRAFRTAVNFVHLVGHSNCSELNYIHVVQSATSLLGKQFPIYAYLFTFHAFSILFPAFTFRHFRYPSIFWVYLSPIVFLILPLSSVYCLSYVLCFVSFLPSLSPPIFTVFCLSVHALTSKFSF